MKSKKQLQNYISELASQLKLPGIRKYFSDEIKECTLKELDYESFLLKLLEKEFELRQENGKNNRIRGANFPYKKYLEDLSISDLPEDARQRLGQLKTLDFIKNSQNVILAGNPGTGKTHLAIGLGIKACLEGYKVLFTTVPLLVNQLKESRSNRVLMSFENKFEKYDLIIADEMGYISFDKEGSELLFTNLSLRAGRKSIIITTNLSFERWDEIFKDPVITAAMIDRLTHKAYIVNMNGNSYRFKETEEWLKSH
jgi:DNA replication protein DnaC